MTSSPSVPGQQAAARCAILSDLLGERGVDDLHAGDVHEHLERRVELALPRGALLAGAFEDVPAELRDEPGLLGDGDELERRDRARAAGCCQRTSASVATGWPLARSRIGW